MTSLSGGNITRLLNSIGCRDRSIDRKRRKPPPRRQNFLLEPLESRLLLSVTPTFVGVPSLLAGPNMNVTQRSGDQTEEAIAINPTNPANMIAAPNDNPGEFSVPTSRDSVWVTQDAGSTWTRVTIPIPTGATGSHGDPTIVFDRAGNAVYAHLVDSGSISPPIPPNHGVHFVATAVSTDGGRNWTAGAVDAPGSGVNDDKEYLGVGPDKNNPAVDRFYIAWDLFGSNNNEVVSTSTDGLTWSAQVAVGTSSLNIDGHPVVGPNGDAYMFWQDYGTKDQTKIMFSKSTDDGAIWTTPVNIHTANINFNNSTFSGGRYKIPAQPDRGIWPSLSADVDRSGGAFNGELYVSFTDSPGDSPAASHNNTNVFVMTSTNGGTSFNAPVMVNDDGGTNSQFFSWLAVDQTTGLVAVSWHDARNDSGSGPGDTDGTANTDTQMFGTISNNGGATFRPNVQISAGTSNGHDMTSGNNYGDYTGLAFFGGSLFPVWADNSNSTGDNPNGARVARTPTQAGIPSNLVAVRS
jgi:hypothetical protein